MKFEHFELAQDSRGTVIEAEYCHDGRVKRILSPPCELNQSKYIRLCDDSLLGLTRSQLMELSSLCLDAFRSEEYFLTDANATDQWLRTVIGHEDLHAKTWTKAGKTELISKIIIHSNIVPYDPYWSKHRIRTARVNIMKVHFPSCILQEALREKKTLQAKLREWMLTGKDCEIGNHVSRSSEDGDCEQSRTSKWLWEIQNADVHLERVLSKGSDGSTAISLIRLRGGRFVRKETADNAEFELVKRFSHPHIVHSFGELRGGTGSSYFMEYLSNDLLSFLLERKRVVGDNKPPFSPCNSVDVLLQIAKALKHMHQEDVNVVHCDLKSMNVLISEIATSENVKHYLVKVADFGSARPGDSSSGSTGFIAGPGTTPYMAPEALRQLKDGTACVAFPHKMDVYSFGIVAFEVLTGDDKYRRYRSPSKFKAGVIEGSVRPLLREECRRDKKYVQDEELLSLIEKCWHNDPSERPPFVKICEELCKAKVRIVEQTLQNNHLPRQRNILWAFKSSKEPASTQSRQRLHQEF